MPRLHSRGERGERPFIVRDVDVPALAKACGNSSIGRATVKSVTRATINVGAIVYKVLARLGKWEASRACSCVARLL